VLLWEPPSRLVLSWEISADWQHDPNLKTEVEVRFIPEGKDGSRVSSWSIVILIATGRGAMRCAASSTAKVAGTACSRRLHALLRQHKPALAAHIKAMIEKELSHELETPNHVVRRRRLPGDFRHCVRVCATGIRANHAEHAARCQADSALRAAHADFCCDCVHGD